jgi:hypothetical protein
VQGAVAPGVLEVMLLQEVQQAQAVLEEKVQFQELTHIMVAVAVAVLTTFKH